MNSIVTENSTLREMKSFHVKRSGHSCIFSLQHTSTFPTYFNLSNIFQPFQNISTFFNFFPNKFQHISKFSNIFQPFQHISTFPTYFNIFQFLSNKFQHISKFSNIFKPFQHISTCCDYYFVTFSLQLYVYRKIYDIKKII